MLTFLVSRQGKGFMEVAAVARAFDATDLPYKIVYVGRKNDRGKKEIFQALGTRVPDFYLNPGEGSHARHTAAILPAFEDICLMEKPDLVLVAGDADSTLAAALAAKSLGIRVAHVEAGLRNFDRSMPQEINRLAVDAVSDLFFVTEPQSMANLKREGKPGSSIFFVGHVMVDNLYYQLRRLGRISREEFMASHPKTKTGYGVVTLAHPSNVENPGTLSSLFDTLGRIALRMELVFPVHPATRKNMNTFHIRPAKGISLLPPLSYMEFLHLWKDAAMVLTDSERLQEETTALGIPCLTLRETTDRKLTITQGTNVLVGNSSSAILAAVERIMAGRWKKGQRPHFWDGRSARRIAELIKVKEFNIS